MSNTKYYIKLIFFSMLFLNLYANTDLFEPLPTKIEYDKGKVHLGRELFFDKLLSKNKDVSCASCHSVYGADNKDYSLGTNNQVGDINTPSLFNSNFNLAFFWNGRSKTYKDQLLDGPISNEHEMGSSKSLIESRLISSAKYKRLFKKVYNENPNFEDMLDAISSFEKTLITPNAKFDRYLRGEVKLSKKEEAGLELFVNSGCASCHNGVNLGGNSYQKFGTVVEYETKDKGWKDRYEYTKNPDDKDVFRVPSLRNVTKTAPYFHAGNMYSLKDAINVMGFYNLAVVFDEEQIEKIEAFLNTLTGELPKTWKEK
ncbi:MAG: cytochrome-c peroxidase [Campylobacterota bacterium]